jgi:hypothetical protein
MAHDVPTGKTTARWGPAVPSADDPDVSAPHVGRPAVELAAEALQLDLIGDAHPVEADERLEDAPGDEERIGGDDRCGVHLQAEDPRCGRAVRPRRDHR